MKAPRTSLGQVVVVGSLNLDYIAQVERLPVPGQTIASTGLLRRFGGKGANQAVAAARQKARVHMIGCVGNDADGRAYIERLRAERVDVSGIEVSGRDLTGTALIAVDRNGENMIIVSAGANGRLLPKAITREAARIQSAQAVLLQFEVPGPTVLAAIGTANRARVPVVLNPSPMKEFPWGKAEIHTLIVNGGEAERIFGLSPAQTPEGAWVSALKKFRVGELIVTRGADSTVCVTATGRFEVPTLKVRPVDTVGAGDAFAGTFTARRAEGCGLLDAIRLANCAGALATQKQGAQESIPGRPTTERALARLR